MEKYTVHGRIGEGAHGIVLKASRKTDSLCVALKRVKLKNIEEGLPNAAVRELLSLRLIHHRFVVDLMDYFAQGQSLVLVFEYLPTNLWEMMRKVHLDSNHVKCYMFMLLQGLHYIHHLGIMHRDLKPANLLISCDGELKIADFGLCRIFRASSESSRLFTHQVASRWYRAPELLFGSRNYGPEIDLWAVGCIFAEMVNNAPLFPGENDIDQLCVVVRMLGTPCEANWPGVTALPDFGKITFQQTSLVSFQEVLPKASPLAIDLIENLIKYHPESRISTKQALEHEYFDGGLGALLNDLPRPLDANGGINEFPDWDFQN